VRFPRWHGAATCDVLLGCSADECPIHHTGVADTRRKGVCATRSRDYLMSVCDEAARRREVLSGKIPRSWVVRLAAQPLVLLRRRSALRQAAER